MSIETAALVTMTDSPRIEAAGSVGFKEWSVICEALGHGRQSIILRKGGIAEGREGFRFKHERFFLFPTQYHQQFEKVRPEERDLGPKPLSAPAEMVAIRCAFNVDFACWVDNWELLERLQPFHIWRDEVVRERFEYDDQRGLQCAFGRIYRGARIWTFPDRPAYGGCRSWVSLPSAPEDLEWKPVLDDAEHDRRRQEIRRLLGA